MISQLLKKILYLLLVMLGVSLVTFSLIQLAPGDPASILLRQSGLEPTPQAVAELRGKLGLNDSVPLQYIRWLWRAVHLDWGRSYRSGEPVADELFSRLPATLELTLAALFFVLFLAFPIGILAALYPNSIFDRVSRLFLVMGMSIPNFWLGLLLILLFSVTWRLFPLMGRGGWRHLILPAVTLGLKMSAVYARLLRANILEVLQEQYILYARAKGLSKFRVVFKHALKNALLPVITLLGMSFGHLLGGSVIVETVFAWPGIGKFVIDSIFLRDYPVIQGFVLLMALVFVTANLLVDCSYHFLDPRIAAKQRRS